MAQFSEGRFIYRDEGRDGLAETKATVFCESPEFSRQMAESVASLSLPAMAAVGACGAIRAREGALLLLVLSGAFGCAQNFAMEIRSKGAEKLSALMINTAEEKPSIKTATVALTPQQETERERDSWSSFFGYDVTSEGRYEVVVISGMDCQYDLRNADGSEISEDDDIGGANRATVTGKDCPYEGSGSSIRAGNQYSPLVDASVVRARAVFKEPISKLRLIAWSKRQQTRSQLAAAGMKFEN